MSDKHKGDTEPGFEFEHDSFGEGHGSEMEEDFFEPMREPGHHEGAHGSAHGEENDSFGEHFSDIADGEEHVHEEEGEYAEGEEAHEPDDGQSEPPKKTQRGNIILGAGGAVMAAVAAYIGYPMIMGGKTPAPPPAPSPDVAHNAPAAGSLPAVVDQKPKPAAPPAQTANNSLPPSVSVPRPAGPQPVVQQAAPAASMSVPPPAAALPPAQDAAMARLMDSMDILAKSQDTLAKSQTVLSQTVNQGFVNLDRRISEIRDTVATRLDKTDTNVANLGNQVTDFGKRLSEVNERLTALEARGAINPEASKAAANESKMPAAHPQAPALEQDGGVNKLAAAAPPPVVRHRTPVVRREHAAPVAHRPEGIPGFVLRGVAQGDGLPGSAYVETPKGKFVVYLGQTLEGAGKVEEIKPVGDSWVVVTSGGIIRP